MTTPPISAEPLGSRVPIGYVDRSVRLQVFGGLTIVLGALSGCLAVMTPIGVVLQRLAPQHRPTDPRNLIAGVAFYVLMSVLMIWAGVGSIQLRRWVRPIMLVIAWTWLLSGILTVAIMGVSLGQIIDMIVAAGQNYPQPVPREVMEFAAYFSFAFMFVAGVLVPAVFVWGYQNRDIQPTCNARHPEPCWTDKCPLLVLGVSIGLALGAVTLVIALAYSVTPMFGVLLTGVPAAIAIVLQTVLLVYLAVQTYRCTPIGWWGTVAMIVAGAASVIVTFQRVDLIELYRAMGTPEADLQLIREHMILTSRSFNGWIAVVSLACLGYMVYIRRYFFTPRAEPSA